MDPVSALGLVDAPAVEPVAREARARLERALEAIAAGPPDVPARPGA
jgi:hypothetical protein